MGYHNNPTEPRLRLPASRAMPISTSSGRGKFPFDAKSPYTPFDAPKDVLIDRHMFLGIERGVVVQSAAHGSTTRRRPILATIRAVMSGVALAREMAGHGAEEAARPGVRGVRFNFVQHLGGGRRYPT